MITVSYTSAIDKNHESSLLIYSRLTLKPTDRSYHNQHNERISLVDSQVTHTSMMVRQDDRSIDPMT
jgi:hypothetical protein